MWLFITIGSACLLIAFFAQFYFNDADSPALDYAKEKLKEMNYKIEWVI